MSDRAAEATAKTMLAELADDESGSEAASIVLRPVVAGRYEVLGLIGAGAMGTVYRARDRELDEVIALKVLKKELAGARGILDRFRREVKLARRVTHRNVARMFDIGEDDGDRFLTMELVEGESLARRLTRAGRLPIREAATIAKDIAAGLAVAHEAGVLHRDLKPDNVIVAKDGRAVITDFGIARAVAENDARTAVGSFIGTPLYMAPEQVEGIVELDVRADLYALGVMLYELLTGHAAWQRPTIMAVAAARLLAPPPDPRAHVSDLPDDFAALVLRLMARERDDRPKSASDVAEALAPHAARSSSTNLPAAGESARPSDAPRAESDRRKKRIAILPLAVAAEDEWLAFGLVEELTTHLQRADGLTLREGGRLPRRDDDASPHNVRELGRMLDVDAVVTCVLVRKDDTEVRATLRIVTVEDGFQLWASTFRARASDMGRVADQAASSIASVLTTRAVIPRRDTVDPEVEELYLKGKWLLHHAVGSFRDKSVDVLRQATERSPDDARIAGSYAIALARSYRSEDEHSGAAEEARKFAMRALDLDTTRPEGRVALGTLLLADSEGEKAAVEIAGALRVAPSSVYALDTMGRLLCEAGAAKEGIRIIDIALSKEEIAIARHMRIRTKVLLGEWDQLHEWMSELSTESGGALANAMLWMRFVMWMRDVDRAREGVRAMIKLALNQSALAVLEAVAPDPQSRESRMLVHGLVGRALATLPKRAKRGRALVGQLGTESSLYIGDEPKALEYLRAADEAQLFDLHWLDRCELLDPLRAHPDFQTVRKNVAGRAQGVQAAYERARISSRIRA